jgi:hypothetical protein
MIVRRRFSASALDVGQNEKSGFRVAIQRMVAILLVITAVVV